MSQHELGPPTFALPHVRSQCLFTAKHWNSEIGKANSSAVDA